MNNFYLDLGLQRASELIHDQLIPLLPEIITTGSYKDFKSAFQEQAQEKLNATPTYKVLEESGPDHDRTFEVGVFIQDKQVGKGKGKSKQQAEQEAASFALENFSKLQK